MNLLASMRYLVALSEHRHFGRAAQACHITQPALSNALRALEESAALGRRLAHRAHERGSPKTAELFEARAREDEQRADLVRQALAMTTAPPESLVGALDSGGGTG